MQIHTQARRGRLAAIAVALAVTAVRPAFAGGRGPARRDAAKGDASAADPVEPERPATSAPAGTPRASAPPSGERPPTRGTDADEADVDAPAGDIPVRTRAPAHPDCGGRVPLFEHEVQRGEHLGQIAGRYGVRRRELLELNRDVKNPDLIRAGQKLRVCPTIAPRLRETIEIEVAPGDTVSVIAEKHGLTVAELVRMQQGALIDPDKLVVGRKLVVTVDRGIVPDFLPAAPPPKPKARGGGGGRMASRVRGRANVGVRLPDDARYYIKRPHLAYGTDHTIRAIQRAIEQYRGRHRKSPLVHIGDISRQGGGALRSHLSHRVGVDVDVGYVLRGADADRTMFTGVTRDNLDLARTWSLVRAFVDTDEVEVVFMDYGLQKLLYEYARDRGVDEDSLDEIFQYPRGRGRSHGIVRHWRSHQHHFHVRFKR